MHFLRYKNDINKNAHNPKKRLWNCVKPNAVKNTPLNPTWFVEIDLAIISSKMLLCFRVLNSESKDLVAVSTSLGSPCTLDPGVNWAAAPMWREGTCFPYGGAPGNTACSATSTFNQGRLDLLKKLAVCVLMFPMLASLWLPESVDLYWGLKQFRGQAVGTISTHAFQLKLRLMPRKTHLLLLNHDYHDYHDHHHYSCRRPLGPDPGA